jgi:hypothetical protein
VTISDTADHVGEIGLRLDSDELAGLDQPSAHQRSIVATSSGGWILALSGSRRSPGLAPTTPNAIRLWRRRHTSHHSRAEERRIFKGAQKDISRRENILYRFRA